MKGYKALDMEMRAIHGNGMQYKMKKWYSIEGKVIPCNNGFHFCSSMEILNVYYPIKNSRIFEVEADGKIVRNYGNYAAEKMILLRELTKKEINDYFEQNQKELVKNKDWCVRCAVADQGYGLDKLVYDEDFAVRIAVAGQGYGLDRLIHSESYLTRCAVAKQGYGLNTFINDENWRGREAARKRMSELAA